MLCCPDILFGVCFAGCFVFNVTVIVPLQLPLSFAHIFHFRFCLSLLYCVPIFLYLVSMYLVFQFLRFNPVCAPFIVFGHVTCLFFVLLFFIFHVYLTRWCFAVLGALGCLQEKPGSHSCPSLNGKWRQNELPSGSQVLFT